MPTEHTDTDHGLDPLPLQRGEAGHKWQKSKAEEENGFLVLVHSLEIYKLLPHSRVIS